ncbi:MAG: hypothetical protein SGPRY_006195 [Prymnesium sp.]
MGFVLRLRTDENKRAHAKVFYSSLGHSSSTGVLESRLRVFISDRFDHERIEVAESKTRVKAVLPKKVMKRMHISRVRCD